MGKRECEGGGSLAYCAVSVQTDCALGYYWRKASDFLGRKIELASG